MWEPIINNARVYFRVRHTKMVNLNRIPAPDSAMDGIRRQNRKMLKIFFFVVKKNSDRIVKKNYFLRQKLVCQYPDDAIPAAETKSTIFLFVTLLYMYFTFSRVIHIRLGKLKAPFCDSECNVPKLWGQKVMLSEVIPPSHCYLHFLKSIITAHAIRIPDNWWKDFRKFMMIEKLRIWKGPRYNNSSELKSIDRSISFSTSLLRLKSD